MPLSRFHKLVTVLCMVTPVPGAGAQEVPVPLTIDTVIPVPEWSLADVWVDADGYVLLVFGGNDREPYEVHMPSFEFLEPTEVQTWLVEARAFLDRVDGWPDDWSGGWTSRLGPGDGLGWVFRADSGYPEGVALMRFPCPRPGRSIATGSGIKLEQARALLNALDAAVSVGLRLRADRSRVEARQGRLHAQYAVSCPARSLTNNIRPNARAAAPDGTTVGIRFVVDTTGAVEGGSLEVLTEDERLRDAVMSAADGWRFTPPRVAGMPVRQVRQGPLIVFPAELAEAPVARVVDPGLVEVFLPLRSRGWSDVLGDVERPVPVVLDATRLAAWAAEALRLLDGTSSVDSLLEVGSESGVMVSLDMARLRLSMRSCGLTSSRVMDRNSLRALLTELSDAASGAAAVASGPGIGHPLDPRGALCGATPTVPLVVPGLAHGVELLFEVVVDATGRVVPSTLAVVPSTASESIVALRAVLAEQRFLPARRGNGPVPQRLVWSHVAEGPPPLSRPAPTASSAYFERGMCMAVSARGAMVALDPYYGEGFLPAHLAAAVEGALAAGATPWEGILSGTVMVQMGGGLPPVVALQNTRVPEGQELKASQRRLYVWVRDAVQMIDFDADAEEVYFSVSVISGCRSRS